MRDSADYTIGAAALGSRKVLIYFGAASGERVPLKLQAIVYYREVADAIPLIGP